MSYDNTGSLNANTWRHVAFIEQPASPSDPHADVATARPVDLGMPALGSDGPPDLALSGGPDRTARSGLPLADVVRRVQALHARRLPGRLPDRLAVPHRVRHRRRAGRHLQRLRLLRPGLPVRRHRAPHRPRGRQERRHRPEVHALLRPARASGQKPACAQACPTESIQFGDVDELRERAQTSGSTQLHERGDHGRPALRQRPRRRGRRHRRVLPAARRARGLRLPAGPGGDHQGPAADVQPRRPPRPRCCSAPRWSRSSGGGR